MLYILHVNSQNLLFFLNNILLREIKKTVIKHNLHCSVNVKNWLRFFCKIYEGAFLNQSFPLYYIQEIRKNYVFFVKYSHCLTRSSERIFNPMRYTAMHWIFNIVHWIVNPIRWTSENIQIHNCKCWKCMRR